jgi:hypothetical protein
LFCGGEKIENIGVVVEAKVKSKPVRGLLYF